MLKVVLHSRLKIKAFYDRGFKTKFGTDSTRVIRKVVSHAQNHFYWPSLTTKIKLILVIFLISNSLLSRCTRVENPGEGVRDVLPKFLGGGQGGCVSYPPSPLTPPPHVCIYVSLLLSIFFICTTVGAT
jgi:hypothetical protein